MPWKESRIVDQRLQFLSSYQKKEMSLSDLCREFGVSRPTGYRWISRYNETGPEGLVDLWFCADSLVLLSRYTAAHAHRLKCLWWIRLVKSWALELC